MAPEKQLPRTSTPAPNPLMHLHHADTEEKNRSPPENCEISQDWLIRREQTRNERGQITSSGKSTDKSMELDLSIISYDVFNCCNTSEGKPVHSNKEDEPQIHPKETNLSNQI